MIMGTLPNWGESFRTKLCQWTLQWKPGLHENHKSNRVKTGIPPPWSTVDPSQSLYQAIPLDTWIVLPLVFLESQYVATNKTLSRMDLFDWPNPSHVSIYILVSGGQTSLFHPQRLIIEGSFKHEDAEVQMLDGPRWGKQQKNVHYSPALSQVYNRDKREFLAKNTRTKHGTGHSRIKAYSLVISGVYITSTASLSLSKGYSYTPLEYLHTQNTFP